AEPAPPGTGRSSRLRPRVRYELIGCGLGGDRLIGTDAARLRSEDRLFARDDRDTDLRWHRCLRCDGWFPLAPPTRPARDHPPSMEEIELPLRGRPLRDKYVLRTIAVERGLHVLVLAALAVALFAVASHRASVQKDYYRILVDIHGIFGGPTTAGKGLLHDLSRLFGLRTGEIRLLGLVAAAYAALEGFEAVGLWLRKRWGEYLTFVATTVLLVPEVYELTTTVTPFKIVAVVVELLIATYLLFAKRLFGLRGGGRADRAEVEAASGWRAVEAATPRPMRHIPSGART
ncbi:MAG: DUF2127 domain-containing protein, partial [Acidimicrobiales bacterium]